MQPNPIAGTSSPCFPSRRVGSIARLQWCSRRSDVGRKTSATPASRHHHASFEPFLCTRSRHFLPFAPTSPGHRLPTRMPGRYAFTDPAFATNPTSRKSAFGHRLRDETSVRRCDTCRNLRQVSARPWRRWTRTGGHDTCAFIHGIQIAWTPSFVLARNRAHDTR